MSDYQSLASAQGRHYEAHVRAVLVFRGWTIVNERPHKLAVGEIDIIAIDPDGVLWWVECKGSWRNNPGLEREDTVLKAIAQAWAIGMIEPERPSYMIATTNRPKPGSKGERLCNLALFHGLIDRIDVI